MAEVLLDTSSEFSPKERVTNLEQALRGLKKACGQEGFLRIARERRRNGHLTKSQRRRLKHKRALTRLHKQSRYGFEPRLDQRKIFMQDHLIFAEDRKWATGNESWEPNLTSSKEAEDSFNEAMITAATRKRGYGRNSGKGTDNFSRGYKAVSLFAEAQGKTGEITIASAPNAVVPSRHVCVIGELSCKGKIYIPLVRSRDDDGNERIYFQFPGGGVDLQRETVEKAASREMKEETGFTISPISGGQTPVFKKAVDGLHEFIAYRARIQGGKPQPQKEEEIVQLTLLTRPVIRKLINEFKKKGQRFLFPNHEEAFVEYEKIIKAERAKTKSGGRS